MTLKDLVPELMFDYEHLEPAEIERKCKGMPLKLIRWIAIHHPDNRSRLHYYRLTHVPIGEGAVINAGVTLYDSYQGTISFGRRVAVATGVTLIATSNPNNSILARIPLVAQRLVRDAPVKIEDDAWLGAQSVIMPGVTVGRGAVVGAGAVVVADVAAYSVVAGVPARRTRDLPQPDSSAQESAQ